MAWDFDDEIGYGKPPRYTRFRKGQSGNPKGRPKKKVIAEEIPDSDYDDAMRRIVNRKMKVTVDGKQQELAAFEAVALKQQADALRGSVTAQREFLRAKERLDARDMERKKQGEAKAKLQAEEEEQAREQHYHDFVKLHALQVKVYDDAEANGCDPVPEYPHPDDFRFDHAAKTVTIDGPYCAEHAHAIKRMVYERDLNLLNLIVQLRQRPKATQVQIKMSIALYNIWDVMLPSSERLFGSKLDGAMLLLFDKPMKALRKQRAEVEWWLKMNPPPEPSKEESREIYRQTNAVMQPQLKQLGFRSLAQLERFCDEEEVRQKSSPHSRKA